MERKATLKDKLKAMVGYMNKVCRPTVSIGNSSTFQGNKGIGGLGKKSRSLNSRILPGVGIHFQSRTWRRDQPHQPQFDKRQTK